MVQIRGSSSPDPRIHRLGGIGAQRLLPAHSRGLGCPPGPYEAPPLTSEEALQQAQAEGLTLLVSDNETGYLGVYHKPGRPKPYQAEVRRGGKHVYLGQFATAEEAALCFARSPDGQAAAAEAAERVRRGLQRRRR